MEWVLVWFHSQFHADCNRAPWKYDETHVTNVVHIQGHTRDHFVFSNIYPKDATLHSLFISGNCSTCFGRYFHPSSGVHTTESAASAICQTATAICRYSCILLDIYWNMFTMHEPMNVKKGHFVLFCPCLELVLFMYGRKATNYGRANRVNL
jgi:hypothetical protein